MKCGGEDRHTFVVVLRKGIPLCNSRVFWLLLLLLRLCFRDEEDSVADVDECFGRAPLALHRGGD